MVLKMVYVLKLWILVFFDLSFLIFQSLLSVILVLQGFASILFVT